MKKKNTAVEKATVKWGHHGNQNSCKARLMWNFSAQNEKTADSHFLPRRDGCEGFPQRGGRFLPFYLSGRLQGRRQRGGFPPHPSHYQEVKKGRLQWKVCVKALPRVTTRPCPPERLRSTTTRGICTSWMGLFPSFRAWVKFNTWGRTAFQKTESWRFLQKHRSIMTLISK